MSFSAYAKLQIVDNVMISSELLTATQQLFILRTQRATKQPFKPHLFKHVRRKVAQLLMLETAQKRNLKSTC
uniref:Ribosomal protein L29 n=1 Tax=Cryptomonas sp. CCAC 1634B TaxID=2051848 RepID=A0A679CAX4_9CRYP|nr:ribosomal protein L29 [Cryptomonas sp. CCAC 1634B]